MDCFTTFRKNPKNIQYEKDIDNRDYGDIENITVYRTIDGKCEVAFGDKDDKITIYNLAAQRITQKLNGHNKEETKVKHYKNESR